MKRWPAPWWISRAAPGPKCESTSGGRRIGGLAGENVAHAVRSLATAARLCVHLDLERGDNDHHKAEAAFKALALALREAVSVSGFADVPSTKGTLGVPA